jgi:hypothetical protein
MSADARKGLAVPGSIRDGFAREGFAVGACAFGGQGRGLAII